MQSANKKTGAPVRMHPLFTVKSLMTHCRGGISKRDESLDAALQKQNTMNQEPIKMKPNMILAANEGELMGNTEGGEAVFEIEQADSMFIPYGEYPHKHGLQIFDKAAGNAILASHDGFLGKVKRAVGMSYPVYVGHPDLPGSKDTDKKAYGWIETIAVENMGMRLGVKWSAEGRALVENAHYKFYSPLWWIRPATGKKGYMPVSLKSVGLTNQPNIPVPALANEYEAEETEEQSQLPTEDIMKPEILAALGLEDGATPEEILAAIAKMKDAAANAEKAPEEKPAEKEAEAAPAKEEEAAPEEDQAKAELEAMKKKAVEAENECIALRDSLAIAANAAVQAAVNAGRITPAEAGAKAAEMLAANDFKTALDDLGKLPTKFKTTSATGALGSSKSRLVIAANDASAAARDERARLVENEFENTNAALSIGERKRIAWGRAQNKNPELFGKKDSSGSAA